MYISVSPIIFSEICLIFFNHLWAGSICGLIGKKWAPGTSWLISRLGNEPYVDLFLVAFQSSPWPTTFSKLPFLSDSYIGWIKGKELWKTRRQEEGRSQRICLVSLSWAMSWVVLVFSVIPALTRWAGPYFNRVAPAMCLAVASWSWFWFLHFDNTISACYPITFSSCSSLIWFSLFSFRALPTHM